MVVLYSTNCPRCKVLKTKMEQTGIEYTEVTDIEVMKEKGFREAPMLEIDGEFMNFSQALTWIRGKDSNGN